MVNNELGKPTYTYRLNSHPRIGFSFEPTNEGTFSKVLGIIEKFGQISRKNYGKVKGRKTYLKLSEESLDKLKLINGSISLFEDLDSLYNWYKNPKKPLAPLEVGKGGILTKGKLVLAQARNYSEEFVFEESQVYIESMESPLYDSEIESLLGLHNAKMIVITPSHYDLRIDVYET